MPRFDSDRPRARNFGMPGEHEPESPLRRNVRLALYALGAGLLVVGGRHVVLELVKADRKGRRLAKRMKDMRRVYDPSNPGVKSDEEFERELEANEPLGPEYDNDQDISTW